MATAGLPEQNGLNGKQTVILPRGMKNRYAEDHSTEMPDRRGLALILLAGED
jgi:hypothetical protein